MRLIDADALSLEGTITDIVEEILDAPTIEPERGRWVQKDTDGGYLAICSKCKYPLSWWYKSNFCPSCGSDMRMEKPSQSMMDAAYEYRGAYTSREENNGK